MSELTGVRAFVAKRNEESKEIEKDKNTTGVRAFVAHKNEESKESSSEINRLKNLFEGEETNAQENQTWEQENSQPLEADTVGNNPYTPLATEMYARGDDAEGILQSLSEGEGALLSKEAADAIDYTAADRVVNKGYDYATRANALKENAEKNMSEEQKSHIEKMSFDVEAAQKELEGYDKKHDDAVAALREYESELERNGIRKDYRSGMYLIADSKYSELINAANRDYRQEQAELRRKIKEYGDYQKLIGYYSLSGMPDFEENSVRGAGAADAAVYFDYSGRADELDEKHREEYDRILENYGEEEANKYLYVQFGTATDEYKQNYLEELTDEERKIFNYVLNTEGEEKARDFLRSMQSELNVRAAYRDYQSAVHDGFAGGFADYLSAFGFGIGSAISGIINAFSNEASDVSYAEVKNALTREGRIERADSDFGKFAAGAAYDALYSGGNRLPSMAIGAINPVAGKVAFGLSSGGNAKKEALRDGYTASQATAYGILNGVAEVALEDAVGGIAELGGKGLSNALSKIPGAKSAALKIENAIARVSVGKQAAARTAIGILDSLSGEFTDEYMQEILDPVFRNICLGENNEFKPFTEEALYSGIIGSLMAVGSAGTNAVLNYGNNVKISKDAFKSQAMQDNLRDKMSEFISITSDIQREDVKQAREVLSEKIKNQEEIDAGDIAAYTSTLKESEILNGFGLSENSVRNETDILTQLGDAENADALSGALYRMQSGEFTESDVEAVKASPEARKLFSEYFDTDITENTDNGEIADAIRNVSDDSFREVSYDAQNLLKSVRANNGHTQEVDTAFYKAYFEGYNGARRTWDDKSAISNAASQTAYELGADAKASIGTFKTVGGASLSADTANAFSKIAKDMGVSITYGGKGSVANGGIRRGYFNSYGEIHIYEDAKVEQVGGKTLYKGEAAARIILGHELTHVLQKRSPEQYRKFSDMAVLASGGGEKIAKYMHDYKLSREDAIDEIAADYAMKYLFSDEKTARNVTKHHSKLAQAIIDAIAWIREHIFQNNTIQVDRAERIWNAAYNEAERNKNSIANADSAKVKNSAVKISDDGTTFVDVLESTVEKDASNKDIVAILSDIVETRFQDFVNVNGQKIGINKKTAKEWVYSNDARTLKRKNDDAFYDKANAFGNANELLQAARNYVGEEIKHQRKDAFVEFARGTVDFRFSGNGYTADIIVGTTKSGAAVLYDIVNLKSKKIASTPDTAQDRRQGALATHSISNPSKKVKHIFGFTVDADAKVNEDLLEELSIHHPDAEVDRRGNIIVYHRTSKYSADEIIRTGVMKAKEDALFFSSAKNGYATDYGDTVVALSIPSTKLLVNDIFEGEVHFEIPLKYKNGGFSLDVSQYLVKADSNESAFSNGKVKNSISGTERILEEGVREIDELRGAYSSIDKIYASDKVRKNLTAKAENDLRNGEKALMNVIADAFSIPKENRNILRRAIMQYASKDILSGKEISSESVEKLISVAYELSGEKASLTDEENQILLDLKGTPLRLNGSEYEAIESAYGNYKTFIRESGNILEMSPKGIKADSFYSELSASYPDFFPSDIVNPRDMLMQIADVACTLKKKKDSVISPDEDIDGFYDAAEKRTSEALAAYTDYVSYLRGDTKSAQKKQQMQERRNLDYMYFKRLLAEQRAKHENETWELRQKYQEKINQARFDRDYSIAQIKHKQKQKEENDRKKRTVRELRDHIESKVKDLYEWSVNPDKKGHSVPEPLRLPILDLLSSIHLEKGVPNRYGETTAHDIRWQERMKRVAEEIEKLSALTGRGEGYKPLYVPPQMIDMIKDFAQEHTDTDNVYDMDVDSLANLDELVSVIHQMIREANTIRIGGKTQELSETADKIISEAEGKKRMKTIFGRFDLMDSFTFADQIGGTVGKIVKNLRRKFDDFVVATRAVQDFTQETVTEKEVKDWRKNVRTVQIGGKEHAITDTQIMSLYLLNKRSQAGKHLFGDGIVIRYEDVKASMSAKDKIANLFETPKKSGTEISQAEVDEIISLLSPRQKEVADKMQAFMAGYLADLGNETSMRLYGFMMFTEQYYFPIQSSKESVNTGDKTEASKNESLYAIINSGMTKAVNKNASNPIVVSDVFSVFTEHASEMLNYYAYAEAITDTLKVMNYRNQNTGKRVKEVMTDQYTEQAYAYIENLIRSLNSQKAFGGTDADMLISKMVRSVKGAAVGLNIRVVLQQPTAILRAAAVMDPKYLAHAVGKVDIEKVKKYCPIAQWKSWGFFDMDIGMSLDSMLFGYKSFTESLRDKQMYLAGKADEVTWGALWNACEAEIKDTRKDLSVGSEEFNRAVGSRLSEIVDLTQVVDSPFHRAQIARTKNELVKSAVSFSSEPLKSINLLYRTFFVNKKNRARTIIAIEASQIFAALAAAVADAFRDKDEDETFLDKYKEHALENIIENINPVSWVPVLGDAASSLTDKVILSGADKLFGCVGIRTNLAKYAPEFYSSTGYESALSEYVVDFFQSFDKENPSFTNTVYYATKILSAATGIGWSNLYRDTVGAAFNLANGMTPKASYKKAFAAGNAEKVKENYQNFLAEKREDISQSMYGKPYANLSSEQKKKVTDKANKSIKSTTRSLCEDAYINAWKRGDKEEVARIRACLLATDLYDMDKVKDTFRRFIVSYYKDLYGAAKTEKDKNDVIKEASKTTGILFGEFRIFKNYTEAEKELQS